MVQGNENRACIFLNIEEHTIVDKMFGAVYCLCEPFKINQRGAILLPIALLGVIVCKLFLAVYAVFR
jgi:hypothetical protein